VVGWRIGVGVPTAGSVRVKFDMRSALIAGAGTFSGDGFEARRFLLRLVGPHVGRPKNFPAEDQGRTVAPMSAGVTKNDARIRRTAESEVGVRAGMGSAHRWTCSNRASIAPTLVKSAGVNAGIVVKS